MTGKRGPMADKPQVKDGHMYDKWRTNQSHISCHAALIDHTLVALIEIHRITVVTITVVTFWSNKSPTHDVNKSVQLTVHRQPVRVETRLGDGYDSDSLVT